MRLVLGSLALMAVAGLDLSARAAAPQEAETAFGQAVAYYCANAIDSDVAVDQLKPDSQVSLVPITGGDARAAFKIGPGDKAWYASPASGAVAVVARPGQCFVSAKGVPVTDTLDRVVGPLLKSTLNMRLQPVRSEGGVVTRLYVLANPPGPMVIALTGREDPGAKAGEGQVTASVSRLGPSYRPGPA